MDVGIFLKLFRQALERVDGLYYGMTWWSDSMLNHYANTEGNPRREFLQEGAELQEIIKEYLNRYDERVFCYELYHQVRSLMDEYMEKHPDLILPFHFQAELRKEQISELVKKHFEVEALDHTYIPDFLLHSPGNFEYQGLVIEVKSAPDLQFAPIQADLLKIQEFITRYKYQKGIFLVVNNSEERMHRLLSDHQRWIAQELPDRSRILFLCKEHPAKKLSEWNLGKAPTLLNSQSNMAENAHRKKLSRAKGGETS